MHEQVEKGWRDNIEQLLSETNQLKDDLLYVEN